MRYLPIFALLLVACGSDRGNVSIAFDLWPLTAAADPGTPMMTGDGLVDLSLYPVMVAVTVSGDDMDDPAVATWPEVVPEETPDEVVLDLEVPAGQARSVVVDLIIAESEGLRVYVSPEPGEDPIEVEVAEGQVTDVEVELTELPTATVSATWTGTETIELVSWVDSTASAILPPDMAVSGAVETEIAVGRAYWPRVFLSGGEVRDLRERVVTPVRQGDVLQISLP